MFWLVVRKAFKIKTFTKRKFEDRQQFCLTMPSPPAIKPIDPPPRPGPGGWNIWIAASQGDIPRVTVTSVVSVNLTNVGISRFRTDPRNSRSSRIHSDPCSSKLWPPPPPPIPHQRLQW
jgi:hypothetical protein